MRIWLIWGLPRFGIHLFLNVISVLTVYPIVGLLWVFFGCIRIVVPPIQKVLLWVAEVFNRLYEKINNQYRLWLPSILRRPSTVIALVVFAVVGSGWLGNRLGATLLPEMKQGRFSVDVELPIGTPLSQTATTSLNLENNSSRSTALITCTPSLVLTLESTLAQGLVNTRFAT